MSQASGATLDREQLIREHLPQVRLIAQHIRRRCPRGILLEDLVSAGTVGLLQAVRRYNPRRGLKLKTLAEHRIRGAILDYLRSLDPLPRSIRRLQHRRDALTAVAPGLNPISDQSIASALGISLSKYRDLDLAVRAALPISLESVIAESGERTLASQSVEITILIADQQRMLGCAIEALYGEERRIVQALRAGRSLRQIAAELGISVSAVLGLKNAAIHRLRVRLQITVLDG